MEMRPGMIRVLLWGAFLLPSIQCLQLGDMQSQLSGDAAALLVFKAEADTSGQLVTWSNESTVCSTWEGVQCGPEGPSQRVTSLALPFKGLAPGPLPSALANLTALRRLDLSGNSFVGELPAFLGGLGNLVSLNLTRNALKGSLPSALGSLTALQSLDLSGNSFVGGLPSSFSALGQLRRLDLSLNYLNGSLPSALGNLTALQSLDLSGNSFVGELPSSFSALGQLRHLDLSLNLLNGSLPNDVLGGLTALEELNLGDNMLSGSIPDALGRLTSLTLLNFGSGKLTGGIPAFLGQLVNLVTLNLQRNPLGGSVPAAIANLTKLQVVLLGSTSLSGSLEELPFGNLTSLRRLYLNFNNFTGSFPSWLARLPALKEIHLGTNVGLTPAPLPTDSASWPKNLTSINLSQTNLVGPIPAVLGQLPFLQTLVLWGNNLTGSIPLELGLLAAKDIVLQLAGNSLSGPIPAALGQCSYNLLDLGTNALEGAIAPFIRTLCATNGSGLQVLDMQRNRLSGTLPAELGTCGGLILLDVSFNAFTGAIPPSLGQLPLLGELHLQSNQFTGEIPGQLANISSLQGFNVSSNNLTGAIPSDFNCSVQAGLSSFQAANNSLTGVIPGGLGRCPLLYLELQHNQLSGPLPSQLYYAPSLLTLGLQGNFLNGTLQEVENWNQLISLNLRGNKVQGPIPSTLGTNAGSLQVLDLGGNQLSGQVPGSLFSIPPLAALDLSNNNLTGPLSPQVGNALSLTLLKLSGNRLNGTLPLDALRRVLSLQALDVQDNNFSGSIDLNNSRLESISASGNKFSGPIAGTFLQLPFLSVLDLSRNSLNGTIPDLPTTLTLLNLSSNALFGPLPGSLRNLTALRALDVARNQLGGELPQELETLAKLQYLDLSANKFSGSIPSRLGQASQLQYFNVSGNKVEGQVPEGLAAFPGSSFAGNPGLCGPPLLTGCAAVPPTAPGAPEVPQGTGGGLAGWAIAAIALAVAAVTLVALVLVILRMRSRSRTASPSSPSANATMAVFQKLDFAVGIKDILAATQDFSDNHFLGRGGFGSVYKASLFDGKLEVAIKRLDAMGKQGEKEFLAEMATLGQIRHKHLVSLLAAYSDPVSQERLLVYNFLPGGDLWSALKQGIDWPTRLRIAVETAAGLKYLHDHCTPAIIHLDIKPQNILLDLELRAHVADFGLAKSIDAERTHLSTHPQGTFGYMAPEIISRLQVTKKADVYAFGMVLLQLVTGRAVVDPKDLQMKDGLLLWAEGKPLAAVIDPCVATEDPEAMEQMEQVLRLAFMCLANKPEDREPMEVVLHSLGTLGKAGQGRLQDAGKRS